MNTMQGNEEIAHSPSLEEAQRICAEFNDEHFPYYTPGPWVMMGNNEASFSIYGAKETGCVAVTQCRSECESNARLIAAAPELLKACREANRALCHLGASGDPAIFLLQAAIEKAVKGAK